VSHPTAGSPRGHRSPAGQDEAAGRCDATVWLHGPLERSLTGAAGGLPLPPLHRCALRPGHRGRHHALADAHGAQRYWFHWDESGFRVGAVTTRPGSERAGTSIRQPRRPPPSATSSDFDPPTVPCKVLAYRGRDEAILALAAAIKRLGDVIAGVAGPPERPSVFSRHEARTDHD
jgi:hypothetical protein